MYTDEDEGPLTFDNVVKQVSMRLTTPDDMHLPWFDYTTLSAINQCPTWGMFRYVEQKSLGGDGRAMALEAGIAAHYVFAAVRLLDMYRNQRLRNHFDHHGVRIFGETVFEQMVNRLGGDERTEAMAFSLEALYNSGFYDDPRDKRRTMTNIEESCIAYIDRWPWGERPIWVQDENDCTTYVGIEIPLDIVIEFHLSDGSLVAYRYVGRADGLHLHSTDHVLHENKTASRLDVAWFASMRMTHQITGYCVGLSLTVNMHITKARALGMSIPLPRSYDYSGIIDEAVTRDAHHVEKWLHWIWDTTRVYEQFKHAPDAATRFTHSCSRYFRPCSMLPYCDSDNEERAQIRDQMVASVWNPLEDKVRD